MYESDDNYENEIPALNINSLKKIFSSKNIKLNMNLPLLFLLLV